MPARSTGASSLFLLFSANCSSHPHAVEVQLQTTGLLGAAAARRAAGHRRARVMQDVLQKGGACAPSMGAAMGGDPSKVAASVFHFFPRASFRTVTAVPVHVKAAAYTGCFGWQADQATCDQRRARIAKVTTRRQLEEGHRKACMAATAPRPDQCWTQPAQAVGRRSGGRLAAR